MGIGYGELRDHLDGTNIYRDSGAAALQIDWASRPLTYENSIRFRISSEVTADGDVFAGAGFSTEFHIWESPWFLEFGFVPGFQQVNGDMHTVQFRSQVGLGYQFRSGRTLTIVGNHKSNGHTDDDGASGEWLFLRYATPLSRGLPGKVRSFRAWRGPAEYDAGRVVYASLGYANNHEGEEAPAFATSLEIAGRARGRVGFRLRSAFDVDSEGRAFLGAGFSVEHRFGQSPFFAEASLLAGLFHTIDNDYPVGLRPQVAVGYDLNNGRSLALAVNPGTNWGLDDDDQVYAFLLRYGRPLSAY